MTRPIVAINDKPPTDRPGWSAITATTANVLDRGLGQRHEPGKPESRRHGRVTVTGGRLEIRIDKPNDTERGVAAAARAASAEMCDRCGGKGDPVADESGAPTGCRCADCREPAHQVVPRPWPGADTQDHPNAVSPGQWTADIRGGATGADWSHRDWRNYRRLETGYGENIRQLMTARNDRDTMFIWTNSPGWAGILRAFFLLMRPEQNERPDVPGHVPWRLRWMKSKFGVLDIRMTETTPYQLGAAILMMNLSTTICSRCSRPGEGLREVFGKTECRTCRDKSDTGDRPGGPDPRTADNSRQESER